MTRVILAGFLALMLAACSKSNDGAMQGWVEAELIFVSPDEQGRIETLKVREVAMTIAVTRFRRTLD
jgi:HlyD family secretion protein